MGPPAQRDSKTWPWTTTGQQVGIYCQPNLLANAFLKGFQKVVETQWQCHFAGPEKINYGACCTNLVVLIPFGTKFWAVEHLEFSTGFSTQSQYRSGPSTKVY